MSASASSRLGAGRAGQDDPAERSEGSQYDGGDGADGGRGRRSAGFTLWISWWTDRARARWNASPWVYSTGLNRQRSETGCRSPQCAKRESFNSQVRGAVAPPPGAGSQVTVGAFRKGRLTINGHRTTIDQPHGRGRQDQVWAMGARWFSGSAFKGVRRDVGAGSTAMIASTARRGRPPVALRRQRQRCGDRRLGVDDLHGQVGTTR